MRSFSVEIPEAMRAFLDEEIASGRGANHSDLIQQLVRAEQKRRAHDQIEALALEALETEASPWTKASMNGIRDELRRHRESSTAE